MNTKHKIRAGRLALLVVMALAMAGSVRGQDQEPEAPPQQPKPAGRGIPSVPDDNSAQDAANSWSADTGPLTGLQTPTIGNPELGHSYWVPGFQYASSIQRQPSGGANSGDWYSNNFFGLNLSLLQEWSRSQLALNYSGGGFVTTQTGSPNGWFQQFGVGQTFKLSRAQIQFIDQFSYLPASQFGFGGGTGLSAPGIGGSLGPTVPGVGGAISPNQSIYAAVGPRVSNSFIAQMSYELSRRSSVTVAGSIGTLHFTQSGNVDTYNYLGNLGYNYALTKEDTIGLSYRFNALHYQGQAQAIGDQVISAAYGRKITRRIALQVTGGPEITNYRVAVGGKSQTISGSGGASISYALQNASVGLSYFHGLSGGSGVLIGSNVDQLTLSAGKQVTRLWSVHGNFGFARNRPLASTTGIQGTDYDSFYVGGGADRPIGRNFNISLAYTAQIQKISPTTACVGAGCNSTSTQHVVNVSLQWHTRPFVLR